MCKFFLQGNCYNGSECLYEHNIQNESVNNSEQIFPTPKTKPQYCKKGQKCENQDCSGGLHKAQNEVPCRYQQRCEKSYCRFKHMNKMNNNHFFRQASLKNLNM